MAVDIFADTTTGDDTNTGTESSPLKTVSAGVAALAASSGSSSLSLRRGETFPVGTPITEAGEGAAWTIKAYGPGTPPLLDGGASAEAIFNWNNSNPDGWSFQDLKFTNALAGKSAFRCQGTGALDNMTWLQCSFLDCGNGIWESGSGTGTVNLVDSCKFDSTFGDDVSISGSSIEVVHGFHKDTGRALTTAGVGDALTAHGAGTMNAHEMIFDGCHRIMYLFNTSSANHTLHHFHAKISHVSGAIHTAPYVIANDTGTGALDVYNGSIIVDSDVATWVVYCNAVALTARHLTIINRSTKVVATNDASVNFVALTASGDMTVKSCASTVDNTALHGAALLSGTFTGESNLYSTGTVWFDGTDTPITFAAWKALVPVTETAGSTQGAVGLENDAGNEIWDMRPTSTSDLRDNGTDETADYTDDYIGHARPAASDIGAQQYFAPSIPIITTGLK